MERLPEKPEFQLVASACHSEGPCYRAVVETEHDLGGLMPYINADISVITYEPDEEEPVLIFKTDGYRVALRRHEIAIGAVSDRNEAEEAVSRVIEYLNSVIDRADEITPDHRPRRRPPALELFKLLPGTNCGECGEPACLAFAVKLSLGRLEPAACPHLSRDRERLSRLNQLLGAG